MVVDVPAVHRSGKRMEREAEDDAHDGEDGYESYEDLVFEREGFDPLDWIHRAWGCGVVISVQICASTTIRP